MLTGKLDAAQIRVQLARCPSAEAGSARCSSLQANHEKIVLSVPYEPHFRIGNMLRGRRLDRWGSHPEPVQRWNFVRTFRAFL